MTFGVPSLSWAEEPTVRVALLQEAPSVRVTVLAPCRLTDPATGAVIEKDRILRWQEVKPGDSGLSIGALKTTSASVLVEPPEGAVLRVNARPYRGSLLLVRTAGGRLTVINQLGLEEYLVSALASEANPDWPLEALKAHAVVSRTMAAHRIWIQKEGPFDMTADTSTHLYHGVAVERDWVRKAVEQTRGQVLAYQRELLSATFHANCGGHTEDPQEIWKIQGDPAPLRGHPDPYCKDLRHFRWKATLPSQLFSRLIEPAAGKIGKVTGLEILERNRSGRVRKIRISGTQGSTRLSGGDFRKSLGANRLRSLHFTAAVVGNQISFSGFGWGHGVGLCQWGAYGMARRGKKMEEILEFYFPGAQRRGLKGLPGFVNSD